VAQSNFVGLRFREAIHASLRELAISYFESYYNLAREKTLRAYTLPLDLRRLDALSWMISDADLEALVERVDRLPQRRLLTPAQQRRLTPADDRSYRAGLLGANPRGLFRLEEPRDPQ
jgi:hypothetical protein